MFHSIYKGLNIWIADKNSTGIKYIVYSDRGNLKADTLKGIRQLIKNRVTKI